MTDRSGETSRFDPRFDPAFQPGYDGAATAGQTSDTAASGRRLADAAADTLSDRRSPPGPPLPHVHADTGADGSGSLDLAETDAAPAARSANPFILVLWVASALMVFGGVGLFQWVGQLTAEAQRTGSAPYDYFLVQSLIFGAPLLMVLGVATATGILFVHAVRWRKRR